MTTASNEGIPVISDPPAEPKPRVLVDEGGDLRCSTCGNAEVLRTTIAKDVEAVGWDFAFQIMEAYKSYDYQEQESHFICEQTDCPATELEWTDDPAAPTYETGECRYCGHAVFRDIVEGTWLAPDAGFDVEDGDGVWRETCPDNHTEFAAPHDPTTPV